MSWPGVWEGVWDGDWEGEDEGGGGGPTYLDTGLEVMGVGSAVLQPVVSRLVVYQLVPRYHESGRKTRVT